jgi:hypothetical protein
MGCSKISGSASVVIQIPGENDVAARLVKTIHDHGIISPGDGVELDLAPIRVASVIIHRDRNEVVKSRAGVNRAGECRNRCRMSK